jgi:hypothetical protein
MANPEKPKASRDWNGGHDNEAAEIPVREPSGVPATHQPRQHGERAPAHPSNRLVAQLNETWRVVDEPLQWIPQRRKGNPRSKNTGWQNRSFCRTREALLRCVREYCCSPDEGQLRSIHEYRGLDPEAFMQLAALPEWHVDWGDQKEPAALATTAVCSRSPMQNLDVPGTDRARRGEPAEPLVSKALRVRKPDPKGPHFTQGSLP